jgi:hypothetical protein
MLGAEFTPLQQSVQHNCHITDSVHAADYTLCVYLLRMREFFRWEQGYGLDDRLPQAALAEWVSERERFWGGLEDQPLKALPVDGNTHDPFDIESINAALAGSGLVYSAGLGLHCRPNFFLGKLEWQEWHEDYQLLIAGDEYARGIAAPPAVAQGRTIIIRREALQHFLWGKVEEWRWKRYDNPLGRAIACYPFEDDTAKALEQMTAAEMETVIAHEIGEVRVGRILGKDWDEMLLSLPRSRVELMVRAVRDNLADATTTLPAMLEEINPARVHFYFGAMGAMRKEMWPKLVKAYQQWNEDGDVKSPRRLVNESREHWQRVAQTVLKCFRETEADQLVSQLDHLLLQHTL